MKDFVFFVNKKGYQIKNFPDKDLKNRMKMINHYHINTVFDIGANDGGYAKQMRKIGFKGKMVSFEPLKSVFKVLEQISSKDKNWTVKNYALGNEDAKGMINVAGNSYSSSLLNMLPAHLKSAPQSKYIAQEEIEIKKIDSIFNEFCTKDDQVMVKIDTQGFEKNVIDGAKESLQKIKILQLEMSLVPLYESEMLYMDMINYLDQKGFQLFSLENGFAEPTTGGLLQVDGIFINRLLL